MVASSEASPLFDAATRQTAGYETNGTTNNGDIADLSSMASLPPGSTQQQALTDASARSAASSQRSVMDTSSRRGGHTNISINAAARFGAHVQNLSTRIVRYVAHHTGAYKGCLCMLVWQGSAFWNCRPPIECRTTEGIEWNGRFRLLVRNEARNTIRFS